MEESGHRDRGRVGAYIRRRPWSETTVGARTSQDDAKGLESDRLERQTDARIVALLRAAALSAFEYDAEHVVPSRRIIEMSFHLSVDEVAEGFERLRDGRFGHQSLYSRVEEDGLKSRHAALYAR